MKCPSCDKHIPKNACQCPYCAKVIQGSELNQLKITEIRKQLKDKCYEKWISLTFATFFLFSGVVGVIKTSSSFSVWLVVASFRYK
jgi:hypothetical protein